MLVRTSMTTVPWAKFAVGATAPTPRWVEPDCQRLTTVSHVAHVPAAIRIIEDGKLRADLVYDKSKLNTERIRVVWLSPNDWHNAGGFRYGNVRFTFDWKSIVDGKRAFWVESIAYGIEACRILLTDKDYSGRLVAYDPKNGDGPWSLDSEGQHLWNGKFCLEIMVEGDVPLDSGTNIDFVQHHDKRCCIDPKTCPYRGWSDDAGGAEFLAVVAANRPTETVGGLVEDRGKGPVASGAVYGAASKLLLRCSRIKVAEWGSVGADDGVAPWIARSLLRTLANEEFKADRAAIAAMFRSANDAEVAIARALAKTIGLPSEKTLMD